MQAFVADQSRVIISCTYVIISVINQKLAMNWSRQKAFSESGAKEVKSVCGKLDNVVFIEG